ncbi:hypothetical protein MXD81_56380 [Microbacteriaceae bacterium K1510]|nr:hypothetical protein [Microbacteriaceae bacterium K1510]
MKSTGPDIPVAARPPRSSVYDVVARRLPAVRLLGKISSLALHLLLIRFLSGTGFLVALWLCPVQVFAHVGIYIAALTLGALLLFGRYELLIIRAHDERECTDAVQLSMAVAACILAATLVVGLVIYAAFGSLIGIVFAGALFARAWLRLGLTLATRHSRYDLALKALLPHTIGQSLALIFLLRSGYDPLMSFILSDLAGHVIAAAGACISERRALRFSLQQPSDRERIAKLARANIGLPTINLAAAASASLFAMTPLFFLPGLENAVLAGTLALLFRLLDVPASMASASVGPILTKAVADHHRGVTDWPLQSVFLLPLLIAVGVFSLISIGGVALNVLQLAPAGWVQALTILPAVALFQAGIAAAAPLIDLTTLAGRQRGLMALNVTAAAMAGLTLLAWHDKPTVAIVLAGVIGFARVIVMSFWLPKTDEFRR